MEPTDLRLDPFLLEPVFPVPSCPTWGRGVANPRVLRADPAFALGCRVKGACLEHVALERIENLRLGLLSWIHLSVIASHSVLPANLTFSLKRTKFFTRLH